MANKVSSNLSKIDAAVSHDAKISGSSVPKPKPAAFKPRDMKSTLRMIGCLSAPASPVNKDKLPIARTTLVSQIPSRVSENSGQISKHPSNTPALQSAHISIIDAHNSINHAELSPAQPREIMSFREKNLREETPKIISSKGGEPQKVPLKLSITANKSLDLRSVRHVEKSFQDDGTPIRKIRPISKNSINKSTTSLAKNINTSRTERGVATPSPFQKSAMRSRQNSTPLLAFPCSAEVSPHEKITKESRQYRSLCKMLKIDKLFGAEKDRVDALFTREARPISSQYMTNQDLSSALKTLKMEHKPDMKRRSSSSFYCKDNFVQTFVSQGVGNVGYSQLSIKSLMKK